METPGRRGAPLERSLVGVFLRSRHDGRWRWEHRAAVACGAGAVLAGVSSLCITALVSLGLCGTVTGALMRTATLLMVSAAPLVMLGAACLDRLEARLPRAAAAELPGPAARLRARAPQPPRSNSRLESPPSPPSRESGLRLV